jgi:hypothetical protein
MASSDLVSTHLIGSLQQTDNDVTASGTDLFSPAEVEVGLIDGYTIGIRPLRNDHQGPYDFLIPTRGNDYIQPNTMRLFMQIRVTKKDGTVLAANENVAPVNMFASSMLKSAEFLIAGKQVAALTTDSLHLKTLIETVLSYGNDPGKTHLKASGFYPDTAHHFDDVNYFTVETLTNKNSKNEGYVKRKALIAGSEVLQLEIPLHIDFLQTDKYFPPGLPLILKFNRENDSFALMSDKTDGDAYKIEIQEMKLYVRYVQVAPEILEDHRKKFMTQTIKYPINMTTMRTHPISAGMSAVSIPNLFSGRLPKSLVMCFLENDNYNGKLNTNPYNFKHHDVNFISFKYNGKQIPSDPYTPNFEKKLFIREYRDLFDHTGILHNDLGTMITPDYYMGGMFFVPLDFSPDLCNGRHFHPTKTGVIDLELRFRVPLPKSITVIMYAVFNCVVVLDNQFNVEINM